MIALLAPTQRRPVRFTLHILAALALGAARLVAEPVLLPPPGYGARALYRSTDGPIYAFWSEPDGALFLAEGSVVRRVDSDGARRDLYAGPAPLFPAALRRSGTALVVGASATGELVRLDADGPAGQSPVSLAPAPGIYDFEEEAPGVWLTSANPAPFPGADNWIGRVALAGPSITMLVHAGGYSGPIALDTGGNLYYGTPDFSSGQLFRIPAADLIAPAVPIELASLVPLLVGLPAATDLAIDTDPLPDLFLASFEGRLLQIDESLAVTDFGQLLGATPGNLQFVPGPGRFEPGPDRGGRLLVSATDWAEGVSVVYAVYPVPEPGPAPLCSLGLALAALAAAARRPRAPNLPKRR